MGPVTAQTKILNLRASTRLHKISPEYARAEIGKLESEAEIARLEYQGPLRRIYDAIRKPFQSKPSP